MSGQIGRRILLPGHFDVPVTLEDVRPLGSDGSAGYECRVRLPDGTLEEAVISPEEAATTISAEQGSDEKAAPRPVDAEKLRLLVESTRIRLAYTFDRQFAVSLSGIRTLPHQIEAVYRKMLPQPRLRFLLADDPGAGKTIMAGLLIKELKLREAIDRCLILVPAPLTIQWQDELLRFFNEPFQIIHSANDQQQLLNLWERETQIVASIDYAKQDSVRERVWQQRWDLVIIDEAHKCSAYTKSSAGRGDEVERTCEYPQRFGRALSDDVRQWANRVAERVRIATADFYPTIPIPDSLRDVALNRSLLDGTTEPLQTLTPFVFLWVRTVPCRNPLCRAVVPLFRQTWLRKKPSGYVALRPVPNPQRGRVEFAVVEGSEPDDFGFDPGEGMRGTATKCLCCSTAVPAKYVRGYGNDEGFGQQLLCVICVNPFGTGKLYFIDDSWIDEEDARQRAAEERARTLERELGVVTMDAVIPPTGNAGLATGKSYLYGIERFRDAYTSRQRAVLLEWVNQTRSAHQEMLQEGIAADRAEAVTVYLALWMSRLTDRFNALARWSNARETVESLTSMKRIAMTWDYPEVNVFAGSSGSWQSALDYVTAVIEREADAGKPAVVRRGSATRLAAAGFEESSFDAVITDPPYYDNESYSELSDTFYVWLQPALQHVFPEHFASQLTPKRSWSARCQPPRGMKVG